MEQEVVRRGQPFDCVGTWEQVFLLQPLLLLLLLVPL